MTEISRLTTEEQKFDKTPAISWESGSGELAVMAPNTKPIPQIGTHPMSHTNKQSKRNAPTRGNLPGASRRPATAAHGRAVRRAGCHDA